MGGPRGVPRSGWGTPTLPSRRRPGQKALNFELESVAGERVRLSTLRGRPVVLHFGSLT